MIICTKSELRQCILNGHKHVYFILVWNRIFPHPYAFDSTFIDRFLFPMLVTTPPSTATGIQPFCSSARTTQQRVNVGRVTCENHR